MGAGEFPAQDGRSPLKEGEVMLKNVLKAVLRVLAGTIFILALAATIGIPAGTPGPAAAQPDDERLGLKAIEMVRAECVLDYESSKRVECVEPINLNH
jgi:hypothetical protein